MHRDLKSANVFLNKDRTVKLGDMNVSKVLKQSLSWTQTGTPYYARYTCCYLSCMIIIIIIVQRSGEICLMIRRVTSGVLGVSYTKASCLNHHFELKIWKVYIKRLLKVNHFSLNMNIRKLSKNSSAIFKRSYWYG